MNFYYPQFGGFYPPPYHGYAPYIVIPSFQPVCTCSCTCGQNGVQQTQPVVESDATLGNSNFYPPHVSTHDYTEPKSDETTRSKQFVSQELVAIFAHGRMKRKMKQQNIRKKQRGGRKRKRNERNAMINNSERSNNNNNSSSSNDDDNDGDDDDDDVDDDLLVRANRKKQKEDDYVKRKELLAEKEKLVRTEKTLLYGDAAAKEIDALEATMNSSFDKFCDEHQPQIWPQLPLRL